MSKLPIASYKSSLTYTLICLPWFGNRKIAQHHPPLHPLSVKKVLEQKRSISVFLYTVILPLIITETEFSNLISGYRSVAQISVDDVMGKYVPCV